jgi:hypothetical protein
MASWQKYEAPKNTPNSICLFHPAKLLFIVNKNEAIIEVQSAPGRT